MDPFGTHAPIQDDVFKMILKPTNAVEFGCGNFSTFKLSDCCEKVIVYEMQNESWYEKIKLNLTNSNKTNVDMILALGPTKAVALFMQLKIIPEYVFVDGHGDSRFLCIQAALDKKVPVIVTHDTEVPDYSWDTVKLPQEYVWLDIMDFVPWTSVITTYNNEIVKQLQNKYKTKFRNYLY
jgi:hypothetical protein